MCPFIPDHVHYFSCPENRFFKDTMFDVLFFFLLNLKEREDPLIVPTFALHTSFSNYACIMEVCGISNVRSFLIFVYEINEYAG